MKKRIVLCADDYGQAPAISQGIFALVQNQRLSAVSCMVTSKHWQEHAQWLMPFQSKVDIGLHFNLTEGRSSLSEIMMQALLRRLDSRTITKELNAQIDAFANSMGCLPAFIDGHQHVHQFPIVRDALIQVYEQRLQGQKPYIRVVNEKFKPLDFISNFKKVIVQGMGTKALTQLLLQHGIPYNQSFSGMYSFSKSGDYAKLFPAFLNSIDEKGLIMCHPGLSVSLDDDPIAEARFNEYRYFASDQFLTDCEVKEVEVGRFIQD